MANYITSHHAGGWRYQHHIPVPVRPLFRGKTAIVRYIRRCPRREAEARAREWAVKDAATLTACSRLTERERDDLVAEGGLDQSGSFTAELPEIVWGAGIDPDEPATREEIRRGKQLGRAILAANRLLTARTSAVTSWDALFNEWIRIKAPMRTRGHAATIALLKEHFRERDCRGIISSEIGQFRDAMTNQGVPYIMTATHLKRIRMMFSAVCQEHTGPFRDLTINPAAGVNMLGKAPPEKDGRDRPFTPAQVRVILETAALIRFGGKRHEGILWLLRLIAFSGARPNEIAQLQGGDAYEQDGVKIIHIRNTDAVSGQPHPQKSVKKGLGRLVPLHPDVLDFFDHAAKFAKDEFIFGSFPWNKDNGRAAWLIRSFAQFLRHDCKIVDPTKRLTLYSLRHRFHDAMDEAGVPEKQQYRLVGHAAKNIHARYGGGELQLLAKYMAMVKPMGCAQS